MRKSGGPTPVAKTDAAIVLAAMILTFLGHVIFGADTNFLALSLSVAFLALGAVTVGLYGAPDLNGPLVLAAALFVLVILVGLIQIAPAPAGWAHPFWTWIPDRAAVTMDLDATRREILKLLGLAAVFVIGLWTGQNNARTRWFFRLLAWFAAAYAIWAFLDFFIDPAHVFGVERPFHQNRLSGGFLTANTAATLFGTLAIVMLAELRRVARDQQSDWSVDGVNRLARKAAIPAIALLFCVTDLLLSASRAGVLSFLAAGMIYAAWEMFLTRRRSETQRRNLGAVVLLCALAALALIGGVSSALVAQRLGTVETDMGVRADIFSAHWEAFLVAPWLGNGMGTFRQINYVQMTLENWEVLWIIGSAHNFVLQWLEEAGLAGALAMFGCVGCILWAIRGGMSHRRRPRIWMRGILCASIIPVAHGMFDFALQQPSYTVQWAMLLGVAAGLAAARQETA